MFENNDTLCVLALPTHKLPKKHIPPFNIYLMTQELHEIAQKNGYENTTLTS